MSAHERYDELAAAYALETIEPQERHDFEAHLATCASCRVTVAELRRVTAAMALAGPAEAPPPTLKARVLQRATALPQAGRSSAGSGGRPSPAATRGGAPVPWLAAAALLACAVGLGVYAWGLRSQLASARQALAEMSGRVETLRTQLVSARLDSARLINTLNVLRSANLVRIDLVGQGPAPQAVGRAFVSAGTGMVFDAERLPVLGANRTYQLWVIPPGADPVSAGVFDPDPAGHSTLAMPLPAGVQVVAAVAVTEEPAGGSVKATTGPLLIGARN